MQRLELCQRDGCTNPISRRGRKYCSRSCSNMARKGKYKLSDDTKQKMSEVRKGVPKTEDHKKAISESNKGKEVSESTRELLRQASYRFLANYEYDPEVEPPGYRRDAIEAYGYKCTGCGTSEGCLAVHHLDGNHNNDDINNLVVLCHKCHARVHRPPGEHLGSGINEEFTKFLLEMREVVK